MYILRKGHFYSVYIVEVDAVLKSFGLPIADWAWYAMMGTLACCHCGLGSQLIPYSMEKLLG